MFTTKLSTPAPTGLETATPHARSLDAATATPERATHLTVYHQLLTPLRQAGQVNQTILDRAPTEHTINYHQIQQPLLPT